MTRVAWWLALVVLLVVPLGVQTWRLETARRALTATQLAPARAASEAARAKVETVTVRLEAQERVVTRTIERVRVDTFVVAPVTHEDTTHAVAQLPTLAIEHDKLQRECGQLKVDAAAFRVAAHLSDSTQHVEIVGLRDALTHQQRSRLGAVWERIDGPVLFGLGMLAGSHLR